MVNLAITNRQDRYKFEPLSSYCQSKNKKYNKLISDNKLKIHGDGK